MANLGAIASAIKAGSIKIGSAVGKTVLKKAPVVGTAYSLLKPIALASEGDGYWGDDNKWHEGKEPSNNSGGNSKTTSLNANTDEETAQLKSGGNAPGSIYDKSKGGSSGGNSSIISAIGKGWDDANDEIGATEKSLGTSKKYISNLGKIKDKYISALDNYKNRTESAIAGNKTLIERNQKESLDDLAGDTRKSVDNTNVMLGIKGASGGSASRMAAKAIAGSAGRERSKVLTNYGDQISEQNQNLRHAGEEYKTKRDQAYQWQEDATKEAVETFKEQEEALKRLKNKRGDWKKEDVKAESDKNLQKLMATLSNINISAKNFRTELAAKYTEYGGAADELEVASVDIDSPASLETPNFSEEIDLENPENAEDWYNPENTNKKRVIKRYDPITGEPIYEDEEETV
ncbi:MAG TPA: hypothetical protein DDY52_03280 [Candidatus Moranbacteria bacterium]|nr:hypothetical protein [Candidatus Moranbacteria bacterium]